jgi:uncharacterized membrane protein
VRGSTRNVLARMSVASIRIAAGILLHFFSWPSIFALNVVLVTLALAGTLLIVPATREARPPRLDPIGTLVSVVALAAIVFGTIEGP